MMKNIKLRKVFAIVAIAAMAFVSMPVNMVKAALPALSVSALSTKTVKEGGSITFTLSYSGDIRKISLKESDIGLDGFTANKKITVSGNNRIVTLSNIKSTSTVYTGKVVRVAGGTAISSDFRMVNAINTVAFTIVPKDTVSPVLTISEPNPAQVYAGGTVTYTLTYTDNVGIRKISLKESDLGLNGFTATKKVVINSNNTATVTLSNIQGKVGGNKTLYVAGGTAIDNDFNMANAVTSKAFTIIKKKSQAPVLTISDPNPAQVYAGGTVTYTLTYTDDIGIRKISLKESDLGLNGFTATKKVVINSNNTATVTLSNIQGKVGGNKTLYVAGGTAIDDDFNMANAATSKAFVIAKKSTPTPADPKPTDPKPIDPKPVDPKPEKPSDWRENPNTGVNI
ncbi:unknown [Clostridium sp. CAG:1219]|nr:unknown [Clostridium sp. CAG:1219]